MVGQNATVFTEDRGTQENKMCCLIYFYFITVMRERIASLIPRNGNRKRLHENQNDVNNLKNYYDILTLIIYRLTDRPYTRNRPYTTSFLVD